ncbi:MAG: NUDIX domain-containing protein [Patescibacteria group bacterium]|nr:NUDIX domain-containing protein [Patescibacteria group bacterium]
MPSQKDFYQISLKAFLKNKKGEVLVLKSFNDGPFAGFYDFPGGRIHQEEFAVPILDILAREITEETGIVNFKVHPVPVAYARHEVLKTDGLFHIFYLFFEGEYLDGEIKVSREHQDYHWLDLKAIELTQYFGVWFLEAVKMYLSLGK